MLTKAYVMLTKAYVNDARSTTVNHVQYLLLPMRIA
jgi:hypothetical protein